MNQPLVALDIGSTKVACAIGLPHERSAGFELLGSSLVPYPSPSASWLGDPLMVSRTIEQAIEATAVSGDFHRALVAMDHALLESEQVRVAVPLGDEPMTIRAQDLERLQRSALHQALGIDRDALLVERLSCAGNGFDNMRDPRGLAATRLAGTFHIVSMPVAVRRALIQAVEAAGLEVIRIALTLPAAMASVGDETLMQKRILILDVGGLSTDVGLFVEGALHVLEVVPCGGLKLALTIAKELQVTMDQALTWSLEGTTCRKPDVRTLIEQQWKKLQQAIEHVLKHQPRPDVLLLSGRGVLIDGFAEWCERTTGMATTFCRSGRTNTLGDLSRQIGMSTAIGVLELATRSSGSMDQRPQHLLNRLIHHTRTILTEYF